MDMLIMKVSKKNGDNRKFYIAHIMGTFLQSVMPQFRLTPLRRIKTFSFCLNLKKFGTKLVIFWNKIAHTPSTIGPLSNL